MLLALGLKPEEIAGIESERPRDDDELPTFGLGISNNLSTSRRVAKGKQMFFSLNMNFNFEQTFSFFRRKVKQGDVPTVFSCVISQSKSAAGARRGLTALEPVNRLTGLMKIMANITSTGVVIRTESMEKKTSIGRCSLNRRRTD